MECGLDYSQNLANLILLIHFDDPKRFSKGEREYEIDLHLGANNPQANDHHHTSYHWNVDFLDLSEYIGKLHEYLEKLKGHIDLQCK